VILQRAERDYAITHLLEAVVAWVRAEPDAWGVSLVGSYARDAGRPDSDVDLVILTSRPSDYISSVDWATRFGVVERIEIEPYGALTSVRVHYQEGPEVEFGFATPTWADLPLDAGTRQVLRDGARVLWDRESLLTQAISASGPT
jgi:predicted nucleotidyltransferase